MSNNPLRDRFMQSVFTSKRSKQVTESTRQEASKPLIMEVKRYISLRIYPAETAQNGTYPTSVDHLEAGHRYRIVLQCNENPLKDEQEITISGAFTLHLTCTSNIDISPFTLPGNLNLLRFERPFVDPIEIPFELPREHCPSCEVTINTMFITGMNIEGPPTYRTLKVKGNCTPEKSEWLSAKNIALGVPRNTIVLSAEVTNASPSRTSNECQLAAWNYYNPDMFSDTINIANSEAINLGTSMRTSKRREDILHNLKVFFDSSDLRKFMKWLKTTKVQVEKREKHLGLVIFDTTPFEIPWELLEIDSRQYLGAVAQVARWLWLEKFGETRQLKIKEYVSEGSVVSYLDSGLEETKEERTQLQKFDYNELSSLEELQDRLHLQDSLLNVGLLYIGSHGSDGKHLYSLLGSEDARTPTSSFKASWLFDYVVSHSDPRPVLFINACESARIIDKEGKFVDHLVQNFLLLCASNYIGTIANVNSKEAPGIANELLQLAWENEGVQVVELLRRLREKAVKRWLEAGQNLIGQKDRVYRQQQSDQAAAQLLNTFSYVYYGNPLARLHLHPAQNAQEGA